MIYKLKIDVTKIDKALLFKGEKGTYLDCSFLVKDGGEVDQYGNCGMIVQDISKESREAGNRGPILGNGKVQEQKKAAAKTSTQATIIDNESDDLPF